VSKQIVHGEDSRQAILRGVNMLANAVKITLGPRGRNVVIRAALRKLIAIFAHLLSAENESEICSAFNSEVYLTPRKPAEKQMPRPRIYAGG
jgi:hypothetical protein